MALCGLQRRQPARRLFGRMRLWCIKTSVERCAPTAPAHVREEFSRSGVHDNQPSRWREASKTSPLLLPLWEKVDRRVSAETDEG